MRVVPSRRSTLLTSLILQVGFFDLATETVGGLAGLGGPLVGSHLQSDNVPSLPQLLLAEISFLPCRLLDAEGRTFEADFLCLKTFRMN